jgi:hypothetical protein
METNRNLWLVYFWTFFSGNMFVRMVGMNNNNTWTSSTRWRLFRQDISLLFFLLAGYGTCAIYADIPND